MSLHDTVLQFKRESALENHILNRSIIRKNNVARMSLVRNESIRRVTWDADDGDGMASAADADVLLIR